MTLGNGKEEKLETGFSKGNREYAYFENNRIRYYTFLVNPNAELENNASRVLRRLLRLKT
ncbi:hypothetical protein LR48_Vigan11g168300 [Vigna angularis]|uniref:Uncharacterized protein n=1 Tax=Phaseolus angularis TaxID=3914 RepID=A0A0L9VV33_PHAAN|nr:hypothetical protein LR48_Vigan11g168300 [Vigna angularis]